MGQQTNSAALAAANLRSFADLVDQARDDDDLYEVILGIQGMRDAALNQSLKTHDDTDIAKRHLYDAAVRYCWAVEHASTNGSRCVATEGRRAA